MKQKIKVTFYDGLEREIECDSYEVTSYGLSWIEDDTWHMIPIMNFIELSGKKNKRSKNRNGER